MARAVSLTVLLTLIVFLGVTFFQVIAPFLLPLFLAGVLAIICQPVYRYFVIRTKQRPRIAAGLTTVAVLAILLVPLLVGTFVASVQIYSAAVDAPTSAAWNKLVKAVGDASAVDRLVTELNRHLPQSGQIDRQEFESIVQSNLRTLLESLGRRSLGFAGKTLDVLGAMAGWLVSLLMFVIAFYYFLADGPSLLAATERLIPVHVDYQRQVVREFTTAVRAVVVATFASAIGQGATTAVLLTLFGFHHFFIVFVLTMLASLIPLTGAWLVWGPYAVWLFVHGNWIQATLLTVLGSAGVGTLDNVIRTYVLHSDAKLHPLLAFVSVLGGLAAMGLSGVFIGPIVACCLHALVKIFNSELSEFSRQKFGEAAQPRAIPAAAAVPASSARSVQNPREPNPASEKPTSAKRKRRRRRRPARKRPSP